MIIPTYRDQLRALCDRYGPFSGRWHSRKEWEAIRSRLDTMTEAEARDCITEVERTAAARFEEWTKCQ